MRVFISYGDASDQVTALRLQALGAVNGLTVYVPPAFTRPGEPAMNLEVGQRLNASDVVLGVVGAGLTEACSQELNASLRTGKHMIVMAYPQFVEQLRPIFGSNLIVVDPANPGEAELGIMGYLKSIDAQKGAKTALLALGTLALGLLILSPSDRS